MLVPSSCLQKVLQLKPVLHIGQNDIQYHVFMFPDIYLLLVCNFLIKNSEQVTQIYKKGAWPQSNQLKASKFCFG